MHPPPKSLTFLLLQHVVKRKQLLLKTFRAMRTAHLAVNEFFIHKRLPIAHSQTSVFVFLMWYCLGSLFRHWRSIVCTVVLQCCTRTNSLVDAWKIVLFFISSTKSANLASSSEAGHVAIPSSAMSVSTKPFPGRVILNCFVTWTYAQSILCWINTWLILWSVATGMMPSIWLSRGSWS